MKKIISNGLRICCLATLFAVPVLSGCSWVEPGAEDDPGQAVGAPTEPEGIDEGFEEGSGYPEEDEVQSF